MSTGAGSEPVRVEGGVDIVGIAVSGQTPETLRVTHYFRKGGAEEVEELEDLRTLVSLETLTNHYEAAAHGDPLSDAELRRFLVHLNERFHKDSRVRDTERSLFFSALMIALDDSKFRSVYQSQVIPDDSRLVEAHRARRRHPHHRPVIAPPERSR